MILSILSLILISIINISVSIPMGANMFDLADWARTLPYVKKVEDVHICRRSYSDDILSCFIF